MEPDDGSDEGVGCDEEEVITEVRFVPQEDPIVLETIYKAVQECTLLHPDPVSDMSGKSSLLKCSHWRIDN